MVYGWRHTGCTLLLLWFFIMVGKAYSDSHEAVLLEIRGPIGPATSDYVDRGLKKAAQQGAALVVLRIDTPGGLDVAMRDIVKKILLSSVPVAGFVAPGGARAASAGTYILYACHIAAMAPATNIGAATPVRIGGVPIPEFPDKEFPMDKDKETKPSAPMGKTAMERKIINDAVAYLSGLAQLRHRNVAWAEKAVREGASLPAEEALTLDVIDLIANDVSGLLKGLHGRKVQVLNLERTLQTQHLSIQRIEPDWRSSLLAVLTNPNVAYILMILGIYGLILEFAHPGAILPGVTGAIFLLLALYAFQMLPVNYAGLGLILLGITLMVAEVFAPGVGILGIGGVIAFVVGSIFLMDTELPGYGISPFLIGTFALFSAAFFILLVGAIIKARQRPVVSGQESILGATAVALSDFDQDGRVRLKGEIWQARTRHPIKQGEPVQVMKLEGLTLWIQSFEKDEKEG